MVAPSNTFTAALRLADNPTLNTQQLYGLVTSSSPFQPVLSTQPQDFSVGLGVASGLQPSVAALSFASTSVGSSSGTQSFTLTNTSATAITLSGFSFSGIGGNDFSETNNCPASVAATASCTVQVTFTPSNTGQRVAVMAISNTSANSPLFIDLNGLAAVETVAPSITSVSPATIVVGTSQTVTLSGAGFTAGSVAYLSSFYQLPTTFLSSQSLNVSISSQYLTATGNASLIVRNGNYVSNTFTLPIVNPAPTLTSISPSTILAGSPNLTLSLTGSNLSTATTVLVNGTSYAISSTNGTTATITLPASQLAVVGNLQVTLSNPTPGGGTSSAQTLQVLASQNRVRTLNYATTDIAADNINNLIYGSVSSSSTTSPNSIVAINALLGTVVATQSMPGQPGQLAVTDDGSYLYVTLPSLGKISRLILPSLTPDISWSLGTTNSGGLIAPRDIETAPGAPHTLAVAGLPVANSVSVGALTIFDDGVARPLTPTGTYPSPSFDTIAWGNDTSTIYGTMAVTSTGPEYIFSVNQSGPTLTQTIVGALGNFVSRLAFDKTSGRLFDGYGDVVNAATGVSVGAFAVQNTLSYEQNPFVVDVAAGKAFFLDENYVSSGSNGSGVDIQAFDLTHYNFLNALDIPNLSGSRLVAWGTSGIAVGGGTQIFIIDGSFVSSSGISSQVGGYAATSPTLSGISPQTALTGAGATTVTLTGANFTQAAVVTWNGLTLPTTWQSATQVTAVIPASALTQPMSSAMYISNGPGTENSSVGLYFTVLPNLGPYTQIAVVDLAGQDIVADPARGLIYVATTDPNGPFGNSIVTVNPSTASIQNAVYTGSQPSSLGISDDGAYLYTGFQTAAIVDRFSLSDFSLNLTIPLTFGGVSESFAGDVKVAPGQNQTFAVSMGNTRSEPRDSGGLAIFDNAVQRPSALTYAAASAYKLAWGKDATTLIGQQDPEFSPSGLAVYPVSSSGVTVPTIRGKEATTGGLRPHYDAGTGLVYSDGGAVNNPITGAAAGALGSSGLVVPDSSLNRGFVLHSGSTTGSYTLDIYNLQQQVLLKSITIPNLSGYITQMVRWGTQGIAFLTDNQSAPGVGLLYILQGSDISGLTSPAPGAITLSPASAVVGSTPFAVAVTGTSFVSTSTVFVSGVAHATTYISPTQLTFQLTAADLASPNYLSVVVSSGVTGGSGSPAASLEVDNPTPALTSLSTPIVLVNSSNSTLTINGTGFVPGSIASIGGTVRTPTFVSTTQLTATLLSTDTTTPGKYPVTVSNTGPGGGTSASLTLEIDNPAPVITSLSPATISTGSPAQSVLVFGTGFLRTTTLLVRGTARTFTYYSPTELYVPLTAADFASPGSVPFVATNTGLGGGTSPTFNLFIRSGLPGPITLNPSLVARGTTSPTTVTVSGSNFLPGSIIDVNSVARATTYISSTQLSFSVTVADEANLGSLLITVVNPAPTGGTSSAYFNVVAGGPTPAVSSVSPTQILLSSGATTLTILGSGFASTSTVQWNGVTLANSTYYSSTQMTVVIPASLLTSVGSASITVTNATATPPLSNAVTVSIVNPPAPTLTSIYPYGAPASTTTSLTITGTGFTTASTVLLNGSSVPTTYSSSTSLSVLLPGTSIPLPGNYSFTVTTASPGGGTSSPYTFTVYIGITNNSMVFNPVNGLLYASVPSSAGPPYGNSVVSVDPATGVLGTPIYVGSEPDKLAISSDGQTLWVGLDGAAAVRQVNLATQTAGLQFGFGKNGGVYDTPPIVVSMAVIPGYPNSIVVGSGGGYTTNELGIYDSGVLRGSLITPSTTYPYALIVNPANSEIYAGGSGYATYTYSASGLAAKVTNTNSTAIASVNSDEMQLAGGNIYTDFGTVHDPESGNTLGTLYLSGATVATGATYADAAAGKIFVTDYNSAASQNQIQIFNISNLSPTSAATIPLSPYTGSPSRMTRWGSNGLAFRISYGIFSVRFNLVQDLSATSADLSVSLSGAGSATTGSNISYTATVTNAGPSTATESVLNLFLPSTAVYGSIKTSSGTCTSSGEIVCDLGSIPSGGTVTVTLVVQQLSSGNGSLAATVSASQNDPAPTNNQASISTSVTGQMFSPLPTLASLNPAAILAGSPDTLITLTGSNFVAGAVVTFNGTAIQTSFVSNTTLTATIPAASLTSLGWAPVAVINPSPAGGSSIATPVTIYTVINTGANHILYDPFSRKLMASLSATSPLFTGGAIAAITPETATVGTPVATGSEPSVLALSDDGQVLYTNLYFTGSIGRFNMLTQTVDYTAPVFTALTSSYYVVSSLSVQPGTENTVAFSIGQTAGPQIVDFTPSTQTAATRGGAAYPGSNCIQFLTPNILYGYDTYSSGATFDRFLLPSGGFGAPDYADDTQNTLFHAGCFKFQNGNAYSIAGGVANALTNPATQVGYFNLPYSAGNGVNGVDGLGNVAPDTSLQRTFFTASTSNSGFNENVIEIFDNTSYLLASTIPVNFAATESSSALWTIPDLVRWGQDGLAALTTSGHLYLFRGAAIAPQLLNTNTAAVLTSVSSPSVTHGAGNTIITLTGSNFVPGVAVLWNGSYRTTTITDSSDLSVAIPSSDLGQAGTAAITAVNPGASPSNPISFVIN